MANTKSPFTIINRNRDINTKRAEFEDNLAAGLKRRSPTLSSAFEQLPRPLREAVLSGTAPLAPFNWVRTPKTAAPQQTKLLSQFAEAVKVASAKSKSTTVGVLDLGARVSDLPKLIERLNRSQNRMVLRE